MATGKELEKPTDEIGPEGLKLLRCFAILTGALEGESASPDIAYRLFFLLTDEEAETLARRTVKNRIELAGLVANARKGLSKTTASLRKYRSR